VANTLDSCNDTLPWRYLLFLLRVTVSLCTQVLDHVMVGIEGITKERGHHLIRERYIMLAVQFKVMHC